MQSNIIHLLIENANLLNEYILEFVLKLECDFALRGKVNDTNLLLVKLKVEQVLDQLLNIMMQLELKGHGLPNLNLFYPEIVAIL